MKRIYFVIILFLLAIGMAGMAEAVAPTDGLVAAFNFDDGAALTDASGNNVSANVVGGVTFNSDRSGSGLSPTISNYNTYIQSNDAQLNGVWSEITMSAWIKKNSVSTYGVIIANGKIDSWTSFREYYGLAAGGYYGGISKPGGFSITGKGIASTFSLNDVAVGEWHMLTGTYDGNFLRFYIDGVLDVEEEYVGGTIGTEAGASTRIGNMQRNWYDGYFPGQIDDVFIYSRGLSGDEVAGLYQSSNLAVVPEPISSILFLIGGSILGFRKFSKA